MLLDKVSDGTEMEWKQVYEILVESIWGYTPLNSSKSPTDALTAWEDI